MSLIMDVLNKAKQENLEGERTSEGRAIVSPEVLVEDRMAVAVETERETLPQIDETEFVKDNLAPEETDTESSSSDPSLISQLLPLTSILVIALVVFCVAGFLISKLWFGNSPDRVPVKSVTVPAVEAPSYPPPVPKPAVPKKGLHLEGVILDGKEPYSIINGKILKAGDYLADKQVMAIQRSAVTLMNSEGESFLLKMK